jgi:hypothetical protein
MITDVSIQTSARMQTKNMISRRAEKKGSSKKSQEETFQELIKRAKKTKSDAQKRMNQTIEVRML